LNKLRQKLFQGFKNVAITLTRFSMSIQQIKSIKNIAGKKNI
jgi:hypothetical protein